MRETWEFKTVHLSIVCLQRCVLTTWEVEEQLLAFDRKKLLAVTWVVSQSPASCNCNSCKYLRVSSSSLPINILRHDGVYPIFWLLAILEPLYSLFSIVPCRRDYHMHWDREHCVSGLYGECHSILWFCAIGLLFRSLIFCRGWVVVICLASSLSSWSFSKYSLLANDL